MSGKTVAVLCGGSNGNHVLAWKLGRDPSFEVRIITRNPDKWTHEIECNEQKMYIDAFPVLPGVWNEKSTGHVDKIYGWDQAAEAMQGSHIIIFLCPVSAHKDMLVRVVPNLPDHPVCFGTAYGQGGFDWLARRELNKREDKGINATLFALKHFPYLCKATEYGSKVNHFGNYPCIKVAVAPELPDHRNRVHDLIYRMFDKTVEPCSFPACTVGATNQALHPGILSEQFAGYTPTNGKTYEEHLLFYRSCGDRGAEDIYLMQFVEFPKLLAAVFEMLRDHPSGMYTHADSTREIIYESASKIYLSFPPSILEGQSSWSSKPFGMALRNNMRLYNVKSPMKQVAEKKFVPVTGSRMFIDDIPYGLCVLLGIAEIMQVELPTCKRMVLSLQEMMGKQYVLETPNAEGKICCGRDIEETWMPQTFDVHTVPALIDLFVWDRAAELAKYSATVDFRSRNQHILPSKL
eukprot:m.187833 g.187833  ORF g.187833 m.187833 type:complete len:463 (-) comp32317_c0_seq2:56-1444(-)